MWANVGVGFVGVTGNFHPPPALLSVPFEAVCNVSVPEGRLSSCRFRGVTGKSLTRD